MPVPAFALSVGMMAISLLSTAVGWVLKRMGQGREVYMLVTAVLSSLTLAGLSRLPLGGFQMPVGMLGILFPAAGGQYPHLLSGNPL